MEMIEHCLPYLKVRYHLIKMALKKEPIVFLVTCGPSLELVKKMPGIHDLLEKNFTISVKQAYNEFKSQTDVHIVNEIRYEKYQYLKSRPVILSVGKRDAQIKSDAHFPISEYSEKNCLFKSNDYQNNTLIKRKYFRPWGVGVMYELAIFLPQIVGCKKLVIIGFDMNSGGTYHFYDTDNKKNSKEYNVSNDEIDNNKQTTIHLEKWLNDVGISVGLMSPLSELPFSRNLTSITCLKRFLNE